MHNVSSSTTKSSPQPNCLTRDVDDRGFARGSIISIEMRNFMVYNEAEFHMNPRMNLIVGPNGTGKSTVVCAIAAGLGTSTKVTGRAKDVYDHIQTGKDEASIKICLSMGSNAEPLSIRRKIVRSSKTSVFYINNKKSNSVKVQEILEDLNIHVDNICQFLPQEKVSALSSMNHVKLLHEVENAAGSPDLARNHAQLSDLDQKVDEKKLSVSHIASEIKTLETKNDAIRLAYEGMVNRAQLIRTRELLQAAKVGNEYEHQRDEFKRQKHQMQEIKAELQKYNYILAPQRSVVDRLKMRYEAIEAAVQKSSSALNISIERTNRAGQSLSNIENEYDRVQSSITESQKKIATIKAKIEELRASIAEAQLKITQIQTLDYSNEIDDITDQIKEKQAEQSIVAGRKAEIDGKHEICETLIRQLNERKQLKSIEFNKLRNRSNAAFEVIKNIQRGQHCLKAYKYITENPRQFPGTVKGPMLMHLSVNNPQLGHYVETVIGAQLLVYTFVADSSETYEALISNFIEGEIDKRCDISVHLHQMMPMKRQVFTRQELKTKFGFDGYIIDLIEAEEYVKNWLCAKAKIDIIPYAINAVNNDLVSKHGREIPRYLADGTIFQFKAWNNDANATTWTTRKIKSAQLLGNLNNSGITSKLGQLKTEISEIEVRLATSHENLRQIKQEKDKILQDVGQIRNAVEKLKMTRQQLEEKTSSRRLLEMEITRKQNQLEDRQSLIPQEEQTIQELKTRLEQVSIEKMQAARAIIPAIAKIVEILPQVRGFCMRLGLVEDRMTVYNGSFARLRAIQAILSRKHKELEDASIETRNEANKLLSLYKQLVSELDTDQVNEARVQALAQFNAFQAKSADPVDTSTFSGKIKALRWRINQISGQIECHTFDPELVSTFERRETELKTHRKNHADLEAELDALVLRRDLLSQQWTSDCGALVAAISSVFSEYCRRIGCVGEVALKSADKHADYSVEIKVKFHDYEEMQILDKARQSGGERAVSTILFLLSLQKFSCAPMILVDEINQGMDARNERAVHDIVVELSQHEKAPQTFVITPKLLTNLEHSDRTTVHCVMNGSSVSEDLVDSDHSFRTFQQYYRYQSQRLQQ